VGVDEAVTARAVFLDRDGVIVEALRRDGRPHPPADLAQLALAADARSALADLKRAGFLLLVVTNQPDVARGATPRETVEAIHRALRAELPLDGVYCCYHDDADRCACRKPAPGLLLEAARAWDVDLARSFMVGDRWRDTEAGVAAGCRTVFIDRGWRERQPERFDRRVSSLSEATAWILGGEAR